MVETRVTSSDDTPGTTSSPGPSAMAVRPPRSRWWQRLSIVWLVPVAALSISLGVAWQNYLRRGELIQISFENAAGIEAGQTLLKYRDVTVGMVESVRFSDDLARVIVGVRVDNTVAGYLDQEAQFWIVRPQVSVRGVTGLDTVLSGVFIAGQWDSEQGAVESEFTGLESPPLMANAGTEGTAITLRLREGSRLAAGAPILYRGIGVGVTGSPRLSEDGSHVVVDGFISAPYDRNLTTQSRFWDASGFSVSLGPGGLRLEMQSIASLIEGGLSFDNIVSGGAPVGQGAVFDTFPSEDAAREGLRAPDEVGALILSAVFDDSVSGLAAGAEVRFRGLRVGSVTELGAFVEDFDGIGPRRVRMRVNFAVNGESLGLPPEAEADDALEMLEELVVAGGLRARLATANIFTGGLMVELAELPEEAEGAVAIDRDAWPFPLMPSVSASVTDLRATPQGVMSRIADLPIEELMQSAIGLLDSINRIAADPQTRRVPGEAAGLLADARALVASPEIAGITADMRAAAEGLRGLVAALEEGMVAETLVSAIARAETVLASVETAAEDFPAIAADLRALSGRAAGLEIEALTAAATRLVDSANTLIGSEEAQRLPPALADAMGEIALLLEELREGGAVAGVNDAISSASAAAGAVEQAVSGFPALADRLGQVMAQAEGTLASYGDRSRFNAEAIGAMRDLREAANALAALARAIQRNPSSLLMGR